MTIGFKISAVELEILLGNQGILKIVGTGPVKIDLRELTSVKVYVVIGRATKVPIHGVGQGGYKVILEL